MLEEKEHVVTREICAEIKVFRSSVLTGQAYKKPMGPRINAMVVAALGRRVVVRQNLLRRSLFWR